MPLIPVGEPVELVADLLRSRDPAPAGSEVVGVPRSALVGRLDRVLPDRRSVREFTAEPVSGDDLTDVISRAPAIAAHQWPDGSHGDTKPWFLIAAARITGRPAGLHSADDDGLLAAWPAADGAGLLPRLRVAYCDAPVTLLICGDVASAARAGNGSGYAALLVRAGALGYAAWLAALSRGLGGSVYGGSMPAVTQLARRHHGGGARHLFTVALGHPVRQSPGPWEGARR